MRSPTTEAPFSSSLREKGSQRGGYLLAAATLDASVLIFDLRMLVATQAPAQPLHRFTAHCEDGGPLRALGFASFALDGPKKAFLRKRAVLLERRPVRPRQCPSPSSRRRNHENS